jgi:nucleotide-binding universal stress UspA family protein
MVTSTEVLAVPFAAVMVHVDVDPRSSDRVKLAAQLARCFGCTLIGISAAALPPYPAETAYFVTLEFVEQEQRDIMEALKRTENAFRAVAEGNGLNLEWRSELNLPETYIASEVRSADLLIVGRLDGDICRSLDTGAAVLSAGRPVLVVPPGVDTVKGEHIIVGWNESREARRALQDSLPLLHRAKSVTIAEFCDAEVEASSRRHIEDVGKYLARHGILAVSNLVVPSEVSVAQKLIELAKSENADLIVTGAYGHSRLGEWIFGGVTRDLLRSSPVCCFFAN